MANGIDMVNFPPHYTEGKVECIDAMESSMSAESFKGFLKGQVLKYLWRYEKKNNPLEDLEKASWYLNRLKEATKNAECGGTEDKP